MQTNYSNRCFTSRSNETRSKTLYNQYFKCIVQNENKLLNKTAGADI